MERRGVSLCRIAFRLSCCDGCDAHLVGLFPSTHDSRIFLANSFGLNLDKSCIFRSDRIFRSRHRTWVFSVHPTDPPFFWSLAGELRQAVLSRTLRESLLCAGGPCCLHPSPSPAASLIEFYPESPAASAHGCGAVNCSKSEKRETSRPLVGPENRWN